MPVSSEEAPRMSPAVRLSHGSGSRAVIHRHGGQVTSWRTADGEERLFLSERAEFRPGAAVRGGVPVIFPQFGTGPLPKHGFARTREWELVEHDGDDRAVLRLRDDPATRAIWPHEFEIELGVRLHDALEMRLRIVNRGSREFEFTAALHTYLRVPDIRRTRLVGLGGVHFHDQITGGDQVEEREAVRFDRETDRVYRDAPLRLLVEHEDGAGRRLAVERTGFADIVVWNPWAKTAAALTDLADDDYLHMLCIEPAVAARPVRLEPGAAWQGTQLLSAQ